ncbi:MAG TPA: TRAFs-binding domain-containing protein, partial [Geminicoccaceae bacterium]|nr:TRAFs-binding domain-containing protein [Geminicoccaceae bacterium]
LGILGRLERERFEAGGRPEALAAAIEAYREAFRLQPTNAHAGIEVLTLMSRAGAGEPEEGRELRAAVRRALESKNADYPEEAWDLWDLATAVELAVLGREWDEARRLAQLVAGKITEAWQAHSITQRIVRLVDPRAPGKGARAARLEPIVRIIRGRSDAVQ